MALYGLRKGVWVGRGGSVVWGPLEGLWVPLSEISQTYHHAPKTGGWSPNAHLSYLTLIIEHEISTQGVVLVGISTTVLITYSIKYEPLLSVFDVDVVHCSALSEKSLRIHPMHEGSTYMGPPLEALPAQQQLR